MTRVERVEDQRRAAIGRSPPAVIAGTPFRPKGDGWFCARLPRRHKPKEWDYSVPDRNDSRYRFFWLCLKVAPFAVGIGYICIKAGVPLW